METRRELRAGRHSSSVTACLNLAGVKKFFFDSLLSLRLNSQFSF